MSLRTRIAVGMLSLSAAGLIAIVNDEGYTDHAVIPIPGDVPTIGFGTTDGVKMGDKITPPKALGRALTDISKFEGSLKKCVHVPLHQWEYDALVNFEYNVGAAAFCKSTLVKKLNAGDYEGACAQISNWIKQPELKNRRARQRAMCEGH